MPSYREHLAQIKSEIEQIDSPALSEALASDPPPLLIDVREQDEWDEGHIPGAVHIPRGHLEARIERTAPDRSEQIVLYCAGGARSAYAAKTLEELGYENVSSHAPGYTGWKRDGFPTEFSRALEPEQRRRYSRHLLIPRWARRASSSCSTRACC
jgi:rhodanese-related sulfurtransferase